MPVMIQLRNVPDDLHRTLKAKAARAGMSLSEYLTQELRRTAALPSIEELSARIADRPRVRPRTSTVKIIRQLRGR